MVSSIFLPAGFFFFFCECHVTFVFCSCQIFLYGEKRVAKLLSVNRYDCQKVDNGADFEMPPVYISIGMILYVHAIA